MPVVGPKRFSTSGRITCRRDGRAARSQGPPSAGQARARPSGRSGRRATRRPVTRVLGQPIIISKAAPVGEPETSVLGLLHPSPPPPPPPRATAAEPIDAARRPAAAARPGLQGRPATDITDPIVRRPGPPSSRRLSLGTASAQPRAAGPRTVRCISLPSRLTSNRFRAQLPGTYRPSPVARRPSTDFNSITYTSPTVSRATRSTLPPSSAPTSSQPRPPARSRFDQCFARAPYHHVQHTASA
ncbi:hypothetical protein CDD83_11007 [Cordyceps sp. RAO-2017]|nr:hypothetical protein CDD83_11007 [Cordyceps sp. RAO-2017]